MKVIVLVLLLSFTLAPQEPAINLLANKSGLPLVTYCELVNNAEQFNGKLVRVRVTYFSGIHHGGYLFNKGCDDKEKYANLELSCHDEDSCDTLRKNLSFNLFYNHGNMILIGRFGSAGGYGKLMSYHKGFKFQLKVEKVERDFLIPNDRPLLKTGLRAGWQWFSLW